MLRIQCTLLCLLLCVTIVNAQTTPFTITGEVKGYDNGTVLYLYDVSDGNYRPVDSTRVYNEDFNFHGEIKVGHIKAAISTAGLSDRKTFWFEGGQTVFSAKKNKFTHARIKGSKMQNDQNKLDKSLINARNAEAVEYSFVKNNPTSILSAYILSVYRGVWNKNKVSELYNAFSTEVKTSTYAKKAIEFITISRDVKIGDKFINFIQEDTAHRDVSLADIKDKVVLIEFWGSWCGPCREENPTLVKIYNDFRSNGFEIVGVASETNRNEWLQAIKTDGLTWINVSDLKGSSNEAAMIYGVSAYPTNFLIDKSGTVVAKDVYGPNLRKWLAKLL